MSGLALNHELQALGATLVRAAKTAPIYKMFSLVNRPAMIRQADEAQGKSFEVSADAEQGQASRLLRGCCKGVSARRCLCAVSGT